jgi:hypothetical protein
LRSNASTEEEARIERNELLVELHSIYVGAPSTNFKAYTQAQNALKNLEDMTFSDEEIDAFLPLVRRANQRARKNSSPGTRKCPSTRFPAVVGSRTARQTTVHNRGYVYLVLHGY